MNAVLTSLNTASAPISRSRFKQRQVPLLISLITVWRFFTFLDILGRDIFFSKERLN